MISSKALYAEIFKDYQLSEEQLKTLQEELLKMFLDLKRVFDKHCINYMMSGGSLLGTIRHSGFIPWDDDIDLMMTRYNYELLKKVFDDELGDKYILAEPLSDPKYINKMPKIFKKNTTYVEIPTAGIDSYHMMFIDLFIIENMPKPGIKRRINSLIYDIAFKGTSACCDYLYPSPPIIERMRENTVLRKYYSKRRIIGSIFSHIGGYNFYSRLLQRIASKYNETGWKGVPSAISYNREIFESEVFEKLTTGVFCGVEVKIPLYFDKYLNNLYGDYMIIPPENKREVHIAYKIDVNNGGI